MEQVNKGGVTTVKDLESLWRRWVVIGFYEGVEELCHWWKYGDMNL